MKALVNQLKTACQKNQARILIIGDLMLDEYFFGSVNRISPEAPVPVLKEEEKEWCFGGAANVAANCKHIGCDVALVGIIGLQDAGGDKLCAMLQELKLSIDGIVRSPLRQTTVKKRFMAKNHQLLRMDAESTHALTAMEFAAVTARINALLKPSSIILISDYAKGVVTQELLQYVLLLAQKRGCRVLIDPKGPDFNKYKGADYLKPNVKELGQMIAFFNLSPKNSLEHNGKELCRLLTLKGLVVTEGEKGITFVAPDRTIFSPACRREVFDLTGAGDTVFAFLALGLAYDLSLENCLLLANRAAAVAISHVKTYAVSLDELIDRTTEPTEKIYDDWALLKIELDWLRADGKRVVFTNGCFDIMHPGHIQLLKEAKRYGDILVVALNSDDSVRRLKGPTRPVNTLSHRATMMAATGFVDFVVSFDQDTPRMLIEYLRPDVLVKGGDYKKESVVGYDVVTLYGGQVCIVDLVPGVSTSSLVERVNKKVQSISN